MVHFVLHCVNQAKLRLRIWVRLRFTLIHYLTSFYLNLNGCHLQTDRQTDSKTDRQTWRQLWILFHAELKSDDVIKPPSLLWGYPDSRFYCIPMMKRVPNQLKNWWRLCSTTSLSDEQKFRMVPDTLLSENIQNASSPPLSKRKGSPGTGDKLGKLLFGQSQKGKSGRNLIMVRQIFNFISESGYPHYYHAVDCWSNVTATVTSGHFETSRLRSRGPGADFIYEMAHFVSRRYSFNPSF